MQVQVVEVLAWKKRVKSIVQHKELLHIIIFNEKESTVNAL